MTWHYTGVGSKRTPNLILDVMTSIAGMLSSEGWILRSGGADGADTAFEKGVTNNHLKEIYVPWIGFNNRVSRQDIVVCDPKAFEIAQRIHPAWLKLEKGSQKLHARNVHQVLGRTLNTPSRFLICWTPGGLPIGGTRTAIMVAKEWEVPVYNLGELAPGKIVPAKHLENILKLAEE